MRGSKTYHEKINASKEVYNAMVAMEDDTELYIAYRGDTFRVRCLHYGDDRSDNRYSLSETRPFGKAMNVDKLTKTTMTLYTYDLFSQPTTYRLSLYKCKLIKRV